MARPPRLELAGGLYHITARGNERRAIYRGSRDRLSQLDTLGLVVARFHWICVAYCQMGNHFHLMVETPVPNLSRGMRQLNGVYAQRFNARHGRVGHLFQGRYRARLVQEDAHALWAARYTFRNPVEAGLCAHPQDWRWSSYRATIGLEPAPSFLSPGRLLSLLAPTLEHAQQALRAFVEEPTATIPAAPPDPSILIGDDTFIRTHARLIEPHPEIPRRARQPAAPPPLAQILASGSPTALLDAYRTHGYRMREIADHLGIHYATVSRHLHRLENNNHPKSAASTPPARPDTTPASPSKN